MRETRLTIVTGMSLVVYRLHGLLQETRDFCGQMCLAHIRLRDETVTVGEVVESLQELVHGRGIFSDFHLGRKSWH